MYALRPSRGRVSIGSVARACSPWRALTSKYAHHMMEAIIRPKIEAATIGHEMGRSATPTPMATIDSPRATIRIRPCRSAKCPGAGSRQPLDPARAVPT